MALLSAQDLKDIEAAIARAEARSAGELVVVVVRRSHDYATVRALAAAAWTLALTLCGSVYVPDWSPTQMLVVELPLGAAMWALWGAGPLLRYIAGRGQMAERVQERALRAFAERGVHHTRDASGLLILISELERNVVILGDRGIHTHIGKAGWEEHVAHIVGGVRHRRLKTALVDVIDRLGAILAEKFPPRPDDTNELPDHVILQ